MAGDNTESKVKFGPRKEANKRNKPKSEGDIQTVANTDRMNSIHSGTKMRMLCHEYNSDRHLITICPEKMERVSMATIEEVPLVINLVEQILATTSHRETREKEGRGRQQTGDGHDEIMGERDPTVDETQRRILLDPLMTGNPEMPKGHNVRALETETEKSSRGDGLDSSEDNSNGAEGFKPLPKKITTLIRGCLNQSQNDNIPKTTGGTNNDSNVKKITMDDAEGKGLQFWLPIV